MLSDNKDANIKTQKHKHKHKTKHKNNALNPMFFCQFSMTFPKIRDMTKHKFNVHYDYVHVFRLIET